MVISQCVFALHNLYCGQVIDLTQRKLAVVGIYAAGIVSRYDSNLRGLVGRSECRARAHYVSAADSLCCLALIGESRPSTVLSGGTRPGADARDVA